MKPTHPRRLPIHWNWRTLCLAAHLAVTGTLLAYTPQTLKLGSPAPDFELPGVDGKTYRLSDFEEFPILTVIFTCNHCPTAQSYEVRIKQLVDDFRPRGVGFLAISPNDPKAVRLDELGYTDVNDTLEDMKLRAEAQRFNFPYLYDGETQEASKAYGAVATPHVFIVNAERRLVYTGRVDSTELAVTPETTHSTRNALDAVLANEPIAESTTKVFGCSVKWSDKRDSKKRADEQWAAKPVSVKSIDEAGIRELVANKTNKLRLINVWATWCGPCVAEFPDLIEIHRMYGHRNFELVTISADRTNIRSRVEAFLKKQQSATLNFQFHNNDSYALIEAVDEDWPGALPYSMLIKPGGEVAYKEVGAIDPLAMKRRIVAILGREKDW